MNKIIIIIIFLIFHCVVIGQNIIDSIPFNYDSGFIIINAKINNNNYNFLFDTGARTSITEKVVSDLKILPFVNKPYTKYVVNVNLSNKIYAKKFKVKKINFYLKGIANGGIIGYDFFSDKIFQINYRKKQIYFFKFSSNINGIPFFYNYYTNPFGKIMINGTETKVCFDTGYSSKSGIAISISTQFFDSLKIINDSIYKLTFLSQTHKKIVTKKYFIGNIIIGRFKNDTCKIGVQDKFNFNLLGNAFFDKYLITFDFKNNKLYFE